MLFKKIRIIFCVLMVVVQIQIDGMELPTQRRRLDIIDTIFSNPQEGLKQISRMRDEMRKKIERKATRDQVSRICEESCKKCPLLLLGECDDPENCCLSRRLFPFRKAFEDKVTGYLLNALSLAKTNIDISKRPVTYTSFGSGLAYQDFVIMVKTLKQCPDAQLDINLIDIDNATYIKAAKALKYTRKIKVDESLDINKYVVLQIANTVTEQENLYRDCKRVVIIDIRYKQFITTLTNKFPGAKLCLRIHETADSYLQYTRANKLSYADVLVAADIDDVLGSTLGASDQYKQLCATTLQNNRTSSNVWLMNFGCPHSVALGSVALEATPHSTEETITLAGEKTAITLPVYLTKELLLQRQ